MRVGQMPFPPEYLAPPAERMKKERKTKTPKNKRDTTGKVREKGTNNTHTEKPLAFYILHMNVPFIFDGVLDHLQLVIFWLQHIYIRNRK